MKGKWLKLLAVLACLTLATGVAACGGTGENSGGSSVLNENSSSEVSSSVEDGSSEVVDSSSEVVEDDSSEEAIDSSSEDSSVEDEFYTEGLVFTLQDDDTYAVTDYTGTETEVVVPSVYDSKTVTSIGDRAFENCYSLTEIVIPDSVTSIGNDAFYTCNSLTEIVIPDSVTSIGNYAFEGCKGLTECLVDENNTEYKSIDGNLYSKDGTTLIQYAIGKTATSFTIPDGVTSIGCGAFFWCSRLTEIVIPDSVTSIGAIAFEHCSNLTEIIIPDSVTSIDSAAFSYCRSLTEIIIPDSVTSIGNSAFDGCDALKYNEYGYCKYLGNGENPYFALMAVTNRNFRNYTIHENTKIIAKSAFYACTRLTEIVIPDGVTNIGDAAFYYCDNLTEILVDENNTVYKSIDGNLYSKDGTTLIQYAIGKTATSFTIPNGVTSIGCDAFHNCESLTEIVIPDSVTSIGDGAFSDCDNLTEIVIPDSVTSIGYAAFSWCENLTIYCETDSQPSGWESDWNYSGCPVVWGYKGE